MENFISNEQVTETVVLDELGEALNVEAGGRLQTGDATAVIVEDALNSVDVENTGLIESNQTAIQIDGIGASINNEGEINGGFNGINIANGNTASAQIRNEGLITSESRAINIGGQAGVVNNFGLITTSADPRNGTVYGDVTAQNIIINNESTGVIDVGAGNNGDAISLELGRAVFGSVDNAGLVQGRGLPGVTNPENQASALRLYTPAERGRFTGNINNTGTFAAENGPAVIVEEGITLVGNISNSGLIESANPANGIGVLFEDGSNFRGTLTNSGTISGGRDGVNFGNGGTARGNLVNDTDGIITSTSRAVNIGGNRNTVHNRGLITTSADPRNGTVYADQSANNFRIINEASGVIDVGEGLNGDAISLQLGAAVNGSVVNRGLVQGRGEPDGPQNNATNQATAVRLYHGDNAGDVSVFNGSIRNLGQGILASETDHTILIEEQVRLEGNIVNTGQIISEGNDAIRFDGDVVGNLTNRGVISSEADGIQVSGLFDGNLNNFGNIVTEDEGIDLDGAALTGDINNRGTITAVGGGIEIDSDASLIGDINNSGAILSETADGIDIDGQFKGEINNRGLIQGAQTQNSSSSFGIDGLGADNGLTVNNTGRINDDVRLSNFDDVFNGVGGTVSGEILGLRGDDLLIGGALRDTLNGGSGDDILNGGRNRDTLTGGAGSDVFVLERNYGNDIITDFLDGTDLLDVSALNLNLGQAQSAIDQARQQGDDTLVSFQAGNTLRLQSFQLGNLDVSDLVLA